MGWLKWITQVNHFSFTIKEIVYQLRFFFNARFKDGTICEAVYFESNTIQEKRQIFKRIVEFVSKEKLKINYRLVSDEFEKILKHEHLIAPFKTGTNEEATLRIKTSFVELSKKLREIKLPLSISAVQGNSEIFW